MGHTLDLDSSLIIAREDDNLKRRIREAIQIHCQAPTMNRDNRYNLPLMGFFGLNPPHPSGNYS